MTEWIEFQNIYSVAGARDKFEDLCEQILKVQYPNLAVNKVEASGGDGGLDIVIGDLLPDNPITCYQCKWFVDNLGDSQKKQIRDSFKTAIEKNKIKKWILAIPKNFTKADLKWWATFKNKRASEELEIDLITGNELITQLKKPEYANIYNEYWKKNDSLNIQAIKDIVSKTELNTQDDLNIYKLVESLTWNNLPITALKIIEDIKLKNFPNINTIELSILENTALRLSGNSNQVLSNLESIISLGLSKTHKHRVYLLLIDICRTLNLDQKADEYLEKLNNLEINSDRAKIMNAILKNTIYDDWLIGDPNSRDVVISHTVKSEYFINSKDYKGALANIDQGLKNASNFLKVDLLMSKLSILIENFKNNSDTPLILDTLKVLSNEVFESEIVSHKIKLWILKIKMLRLGLINLNKDEVEKNSDYINTFLGKDFEINTEYTILELISIGFIADELFIQKIFEGLKKSKYVPSQKFLLIFVIIAWDFVDKQTLLDYLNFQKADSLIILFTYLSAEEFDNYVECLLSQINEEMFYQHLLLYTNPQLCLKLIYAAYDNKKTVAEKLFDIELIKYHEVTIDQVDTQRVEKLLRNIDFKNKDEFLLHFAKDIAYNLKQYDVEQKIIEILELKTPSFLISVGKMINYYNQGFFLRSKKLAEEILQDTLSFVELNEWIKNQFLLFYLQSCIKVQSKSIHINNLEELSKFINTPIYELYFTFSEYLIKNFGYCEDFCESLELAYKLVDSDNFNFRYCMNSILLSCFPTPECSSVKNNTFVKLSNGVWLSIASGRGLKLGATAISKEDNKYPKLIDKKLGDIVDWLTPNYSNIQIKIDAIVNLPTYISIRGFEHRKTLNQIDDKHGYTLELNLDSEDKDGLLQLSRMVKDKCGVDSEIIEKFESGEYPYFLLATSLGGVSNAYPKLQEFDGVLNSNFGSAKNINTQYLSLESLVNSKHPVYVDFTSAIILLEAKLLDEINSLLNVKLPISLLVYLRSKTEIFGGIDSGFSLGYNVKTQRQYIQTHLSENIEALKEVADKMEIKQSFYSDITEIYSESICLQKITKDIALPVYLNIKEPESGIYTESADFINLIQEVEIPDYKPEYFSTYVLIHYLFLNRLILWDKFLDVYFYLSVHKSIHLTLNCQCILNTLTSDIKNNLLSFSALKKLNLIYYFNPKYSNKEHSLDLILRSVIAVFIRDYSDVVKLGVYKYLFDCYLISNSDLENFKDYLLSNLKTLFNEGNTSKSKLLILGELINFITSYNPPPQ